MAAVDSAKRFDHCSFDEALELAGTGRAQAGLVLLAGFSVMASTNEAMGMSIILPAGHCELQLDSGQMGLIGGAIFLGIMTASYFWGYLADTRGRRWVLQRALLGTGLCSVACVASVASGGGFWPLLALRFATGLCISAPSAIAYAYLGEFCPTAGRQRTQLISYASAIAFCGFVYVAVFGWLILSHNWSWRWLFIVYSTPAFLTAIAYYCCPESPRFLLSQGRADEALAVLRMLHRINKDSSGEFDVRSLEAEGVRNESRNTGFHEILQSLKNQTVPLFKLPYLKFFLVCIMHSISSFAVYGGLALWFPKIMNQVIAEQSNAVVCEILQSNVTSSYPQPTACNDHIEPETFIYTALLGLLGAAYSLLLSLALRKVSGRNLLVLHSATAGAAGMVLQFVTNSYAMAALFSVEILFTGMCVMVVNALAVGLFPTQVRAMAVSLVNMAGRFSCSVASYGISLLLAANCPLAFCLLSGALFASSGLTFLLPSSG